MGWIGIDLDGTLAEYHGWRDGAIGRLVPAMAERVRGWLRDGKDVRIFTARAVDPKEVPKIHAWLLRAGLPPLVVTNVKDLEMEELWDDRAVRVVRNKGVPYTGLPDVFQEAQANEVSR